MEITWLSFTIVWLFYIDPLPVLVRDIEHDEHSMGCLRHQLVHHCLPSVSISFCSLVGHHSRSMCCAHFSAHPDLYLCLSSLFTSGLRLLSSTCHTLEGILVVNARDKGTSIT